VSRAWLSVVLLSSLVNVAVIALTTLLKCGTPCWSLASSWNW